MDLSGKVAVVTGASRGIGQGIAVALAEAGADVASLHLPEPDGNRDTVEQVEALERRALFVDGSTAAPDVVEAFADRVTDELGDIDIWVNNAAAIMVKPFLETSDEDWSRLLGSNLFGYIHGARAAVRRMAPRRTGRIVNISSITAHQAITDMTAYITAKGGVVSFTKALALEVGPLGIGVNAVAPGAISTPLNAELYTPAVRAVYEDRIALGRIGVPRDIATAVLFLCSDAASYVCGHELVVDGGMTINGNVGFEPES
ncbi:SDR family NAD(P)-dependent oxidoreductase [Petropleomorpha daqingensis]|uniref:NAD(P)-dependent dehydrogenase (Short-subunit alcohol dehydrogenase family) n=1 Tax=Petropleomorpha daqingensis TaxID=2026353 RepID=A0A853CLP9_9ACTN|nr:glucose 1-dehydrogenase [Petropleomorpha daqingensis]NYJ07188.1 NAD(P)-dependent dehydrogenase (short-subunit alcohol dehydrogenase family) [Petropleomorpha daqingensis]